MSAKRSLPLESGNVNTRRLKLFVNNSYLMYEGEKTRRSSRCGVEKAYPNKRCIMSGIVSSESSVLTKTPAEATVSSAPYW